MCVALKLFYVTSETCAQVLNNSCMCNVGGGMNLRTQNDTLGPSKLV